MNHIKIEIIISDMLLDALLSEFDRHNITGYTAIPILRGKGTGHGEQLSEGLLPTTKKTLIFAVVDSKISDQIIDKISPIINELDAWSICYPVRYLTQKM